MAVDLSLNLLNWESNSIQGFFSWIDVSSNVSGNYTLKQVNNNLNIIISENGSYTDQGNYIKSDTINNSNIINYFNHLNITESSRKYKLYHNNFDLNIEFNLPSLGFFTPPTIFFYIKSFNGILERHVVKNIDGYFKWDIDNRVYTSPINNNEIEYLFKIKKNLYAKHSFTNYDGIFYEKDAPNPEYSEFINNGEILDIDNGGVAEISEFYTDLIEVTNLNSNYLLDYPSGVIIEDDGGKIIKMKYPDNPWSDEHYKISSEGPYYSSVATFDHSSIIYDIPIAPIWYKDGVRILKYYDDGALIQYRWRAGKIKNWQHHGQLKGEGNRKATWDSSGDLINENDNAPFFGKTWQKIDPTIGNEQIRYTLESPNMGFNIRRYHDNPIVLTDLTVENDDDIYIQKNIQVGIGTFDAYIFSQGTDGNNQNNFFSPKNHISITIDPLGNWRCNLLPPSGEIDTQTSYEPLASREGRLTQNKKFASDIRNRRICS